MTSSEQSQTQETPPKRDETLAFLFLSLVLFPILAVIIVGGYGFIVWMQHLMFGPPGS